MCAQVSDAGAPGLAGASHSAWASIDWREHLHSVAVDGRQVNYCDYGPTATAARPPLVLIHGLGGCWQNWLENIPDFGRDRRVLAFDLPGFGHSQMPTGEISISLFGHTVDALCHRLEIDTVDAAGHSMGGFSAAELAIAFPTRVRHLVLVAAAGISSVNAPRGPTMRFAKLTRLATPVVKSQRVAIATRPRARAAALRGVVRHPEQLSPEMAYELMLGAGRPGFLPSLDALLGYDFRHRLPEVQAPTLVVWGDRDLVVPVRDADEYVRLIPNARKVIFPDCGHMPLLEQPEHFNQEVRDFLTPEAGAVDGSGDGALGGR